MVPIPDRVWTASAAELAAALAMLAAMRFRAEVWHGIGHGPAAPAAPVDFELAIGVLTAAQVRAPSLPEAWGVRTLAAMRADLDALPADTAEARSAWGDGWATYRRLVELAGQARTQQHGERTAAELATWMSAVAS